MDKVKPVLLFLAEGFEDLEAVSILDIMGWTEYRKWVPTVKVVTTGFREQVHSRFGLTHQIDMLFDHIKTQDYSSLAIPGGFHSHGFDEAYDERLRELCRQFHAQQSWIATFCVGILPVAESGILQGVKATYPYSSQHDNISRLKSLGATVQKEPLVIDKRIVSCRGPANSLDVSYALLKALIGESPCREVKRLMCRTECLSEGM